MRPNRVSGAKRPLDGTREVNDGEDHSRSDDECDGDEETGEPDDVERPRREDEPGDGNRRGERAGGYEEGAGGTSCHVGVEFSRFRRKCVAENRNETR